MFLCVLKLGTPINITMPSASLTPKQCSLTEREADISAESGLQSALDEKKIITESKFRGGLLSTPRGSTTPQFPL